MDLAGKLNQTLLYWAPTLTNRYGNVGFADPIEIKGRWEDHAERIILPDNSVFVSTARMFLLCPVELRGYLWLGDLCDYPGGSPSSNNDASEIRITRFIPSVKNTQTLYMAFA